MFAVSDLDYLVEQALTECCSFIFEVKSNCTFQNGN